MLLSMQKKISSSPFAQLSGNRILKFETILSNHYSRAQSNFDTSNLIKKLSLTFKRLTVPIYGINSAKINSKCSTRLMNMSFQPIFKVWRGLLRTLSIKTFDSIISIIKGICCYLCLFCDKGIALGCGNGFKYRSVS